MMVPPSDGAGGESRGMPDPIAAPPAPGRRRRTRSVATPQQKVAVASVAALGVFVAAFGDAAPTGHAVVDLIYRAGFVAVLAVAGSRARRWALVVASAVAAAASLGPALVAAVIALIGSAVLVGTDQRNRVWGASIGALVALALLNLHLDLFFGASAIAAGLAAAVVLRSGYRNTARRVRVRLRRWIIGATVVLAASSVLAIVQAVVSRADLTDAVTATSAGIRAVGRGDERVAVTRFDAAEASFTAVASRADRWWNWPVALVPVVSQNVRVVADVSRSGATLADAAGMTVREVDYDALTGEGGTVDLAALARLSRPVHVTADRLAVARRDVNDLDSRWVVSLLRSRLEEFAAKLDSVDADAQLAAVAVDDIPTLLGAGGERRYLVLLGNPAEARDLGGHVGNWAVLKVADGDIDLEQVGRPLDLENRPAEADLSIDQGYPQSLLEMKPAWYPQNWSATPDFPTASRIASVLYEKKTGQHIDGVFYADPFVVESMLEVTGPVPIPELNRSLAAKDAVKFLTEDQFVLFDGKADGDDAVTELVKRIFNEFTESRLPGPKRIGDLFGPLVREGRFRFDLPGDPDDPLIRQLGLNSGVRAEPGADLIAVISRNANPSKIDAFLDRESSYTVDWNPETGAVRATVKVVLTNNAPASGLPSVVIGNGVGAPEGTNVTNLAVLSPFEVTSAEMDSESVSVSPVSDGLWWRHTIEVPIPAQGRRVVTVTVSGKVAPGDEYRLLVAGQPLVNRGPFVVKVTPRSGDIVAGPGLRISRRAAIAQVGDIGQTVITLRAER